MLLQLLLVGYVLTYIFETRHAGLVILVLTVMLFAASWIALRPLPGNRRQRSTPRRWDPWPSAAG